MDEPQGPITLAEAAERLGVHYMTAYRYVRTGRLPAHKVGQEWRVDPADLRVEPEGPRPVPVPGRGRRRDRTRDLVDRLVNSDEAGAWSIIETSLGGGMDPDDLYVELLGPALEVIGDGWERGEVSIAEEHQASTIVSRLIGRMGPRFAQRGRTRGTVVIGAAPGDVHGLPTALVADLVRHRRFEVVDLGADVPVESWHSTCATAERLAVVGICATTRGHDEAVALAIDAVREVTEAPVLLGGGAIRDEAHARSLGATASSDSLAGAADAIEALATGSVAAPRPAS